MTIIINTMAMVSHDFDRLIILYMRGTHCFNEPPPSLTMRVTITSRNSPFLKKIACRLGGQTDNLLIKIARFHVVQVSNSRCSVNLN